MARQQISQATEGMRVRQQVRRDPSLVSGKQRQGRGEEVSDLQDSATNLTNKHSVYIHSFGFLFGLSQRTDTSFQVALFIILANYRSEIFHNKTICQFLKNIFPIN